MNLLVDTCVIGIVLNDCLGKSEPACLEILNRWLNRERNTGDKPRTWKTLLDALSEVGNRQFVENLRKQKFKPQYPQ